MSRRLDQEREQRLQPERMKHAKGKIEALGYLVEQVGDDQLCFTHNSQTVRFYPYSGWATGKSIKDGRGLAHLLNQLRIADAGNR